MLPVGGLDEAISTYQAWNECTLKRKIMQRYTEQSKNEGEKLKTGEPSRAECPDDDARELSRLRARRALFATMARNHRHCYFCAVSPTVAAGRLPCRCP